MVSVYFDINSKVLNTFNNKKGIVYTIIDVDLYQILYEDNTLELVEVKDLQSIN